MKPSEVDFNEVTVQKPIEVNINELTAFLKKWRVEHDVSSYLGAMMTTKGMLILLFSPRFNKDIAFLVIGSEASKALTRTFETLELVMPVQGVY
ncbi:MAG: hypothetical protein SGI74_08680 [Oligoflexia bacterium]|nr:hypothetical protein [Oligoflexia bacterium]